MKNTWRRAARPLAWYYAITIAAPFANGAAGSPRFAKHTLVVFAVPLLFIGMACMIGNLARAARSTMAHARNR